MSYKGNNILGDKKYKKKFKKIKNIDENIRKYLIKMNRQFLHAKNIGFIHPNSKKIIKFSSNLPKDLDKLLKMLRKSG